MWRIVAPDDDLNVDEDRRRERDAAERRIVDRVRVRAPARRREERQRDRQAEEHLRETGVTDRDRRGQEEQDRQPAQHALRDHRRERADAEPPQPPPRLNHPQPHGEDDRQEADGARDHPMPVLVQDAADHLLERKREHEVAVRVRPVGHCQSRVGAGDHAAGGDEQHGCGGDGLDVAVQPAHVVALNVKLTGFASFSPSVTVSVRVPSFSCHASIVYVPAGRFFSSNAPPLAVTAKYG